MKPKLLSIFKVTNDIEAEIADVANNGDYDLLLVGLGKSIFEGSLLGKVIGFTTRIINPDRLIDKFKGKEGLFENSPFDERTRQIVAKTKTPLGILIDNDFEQMDHVFVPILKSDDAVLMDYVQKMIYNNNSKIHLVDSNGFVKNNFVIQSTVVTLLQKYPNNISVISTFYNYVSWKSYFETRKIPKTESILELNHTDISPKFNYAFLYNEKLYTAYTMTTAMLSLQWSPLSDFMQTPTGRIEIEKRFPKFTFQFTQSLGKLWENDFNFSKFDFKTEYEKKYLNGQKTALLFQAGYALGDIPLTHLYNTSPNNITKETVIQRITFGGKNSFETMFFNEFFSNKYALFQFKHAFNRVTLFKKIKPSLVLVSRMAWGNLDHPEQHVGLNFKTLHNGFFESGIELNQIFNGLGLTTFFRYGPNQLPRFEDNIAIKLSYVLNLGF